MKIFEFLKNISAKSENDIEKAFLEKAESLEKENSELKAKLEQASASDTQAMQTKLNELQAKYQKLETDYNALKNEDAATSPTEPTQGVLIGTQEQASASRWNRSYQLKT